MTLKYNDSLSEYSGIPGDFLYRFPYFFQITMPIHHGLV